MLSYIWGGQSNSSKTENEDAELAMKEQLDAHGTFSTKIDGTMEFNHFLILRSIIFRQTDRKFHPLKLQLKTRQFEIFHAKNQLAYDLHFQEAQKLYNDCMLQMTKKACEWIEFDFKNYQLTYDFILENEEQTNQLMRREQEVRETLEILNTPITMTEEQAVQALMYKIQEELNMHRKLQTLQFTTSETQRQHFSALENCKVSNKIQEKFGFDGDELNVAIKHFNLTQNKKIQSFIKISRAQKESEQKKEFERATPKPEVIQEFVKKGLDLGKPQIKSDGTMTFDYFLSTMKICIEYTIKHTLDGLVDCQAQRRAALKAGDLQEYQDLILKASNWEQLSSRIIQGNLYQNLNVTPQIFQNTMQTYLTDQGKKALFDKEIEELRERLTKREVKVLTKEECLIAQTKLESLKLEIQKKLFEGLHIQKHQKPVLDAIVQVEKMKADDAFFNEMGFEGSDVLPNLERLNLLEDKELQSILENSHKQAQKYLVDKQSEIENLTQNMGELQVNEQDNQNTLFVDLKEHDGALF